ncbi:hypothetical protein C8R44DRAFT_822318 [Mycena epipterygia]|nr:hypothetical protein C8R44DRAFT_822318 [Mycena epipterygia]
MASALAVYVQHQISEKQAPNLGNGGTTGKTLGRQAKIYPTLKPLHLSESHSRNVGHDTARFFAPLVSSAPTTDLAQYVVDPILLQLHSVPAFPLDANPDLESVELTADFYGGKFFPDHFLPDFLSHDAVAPAGDGAQCRAENFDDPLKEGVADKAGNWETENWNILRLLGASDSMDSVALGEDVPESDFNDIPIFNAEAGTIVEQGTWSEQNEDILRRLFPVSDSTGLIADFDNMALPGGNGYCNSYSVDGHLPAICSQEMLPTASSQGVLDLESLFARSPQDDGALLPPSSELYYPPLAETMGAIDSASLFVGCSQGEFLDGASVCSSSHSYASTFSATSHGSPPGSSKSPILQFCRLPPDFDIEAELSRVKPFYERGVCQWNGCDALIDFGAKEMTTHMLDVHGIHFNKWRPVLCMWPDCHDTPKGTRSALAWMVRHIRSVHLPADRFACPLCPSYIEPYVNRQSLRKHLLLHLP